MDGIYIAYFSGWLGNSFGIFHLAHGKVRGFDAGGLLYLGEFSVDADGHCGGGKLRPDFAALPDSSAVAPQLLDAELDLPPGFCNGQLHSITTPVGHVSVSFERLVRI
jgi:hypothetical protein